LLGGGKDGRLLHLGRRSLRRRLKGRGSRRRRHVRGPRARSSAVRLEQGNFGVGNGTAIHAVQPLDPAAVVDRGWCELLRPMSPASARRGRGRNVCAARHRRAYRDLAGRIPPRLSIGSVPYDRRIPDSQSACGYRARPHEFTRSSARRRPRRRALRWPDGEFRLSGSTARLDCPNRLCFATVS